MEKLKNYGDRRQLAWCVYCTGATESRDHVPSRVLLDEPLPADLPVVFACNSCNHGFSRDEEYVACLVECAIAGSTAPDALRRSKIKATLQKSPSLAARLESARMRGEGFNVEVDRVRNVALKLARGHAAFELNEPQFRDPTTIAFAPLETLDPAARAAFESPPPTVWPEVGSRAMQRIANDGHGWVVVQPGRYRFLVAVGTSVVVRVVLSEYLAVEVAWE